VPGTCSFENLLGILPTGTSSLSGFGLDVQVNEEEAREEGAKGDGKVCAELDLQCDRVRGQGLNDGVQGEGRGGNGSDGQCTGGDLSEGGLGNCEIGRRAKAEVTTREINRRMEDTEKISFYRSEGTQSSGSG
jgi:hypothetical protein